MMKRLLLLLGLIVCVSVSMAGYSDGYITTGEYEYGVRWYSNNPPLIVNGGGADIIEVRDYGRLEVLSTSTPVNGNWNVGGIRDILIVNRSELLYLGGETGVIATGGNATALLKGGTINTIQSFQKVINNTPYINLYCQPDWSWMYNTTGDIKGITGLWKNGTPFSIQFLDQTASGYDPVWKNINVIPEPITLFLFGLGGLLLRQKK